MLKILNYILHGFGFEGWYDFTKSTFGFMTSAKLISYSSVLAIVAAYANELFGLSLSFLIAYFILIVFEWLTGILASARRKEKHSSRKLGRMLLKIAVYMVPLYIFNMFSKEVNFPEIAGFEIDPFIWLYWVVIIVIIWQLLVSLLENMEELNIKYATVLLKIINRKFYKNFDIDDEKD